MTAKEKLLAPMIVTKLPLVMAVRTAFIARGAGIATLWPWAKFIACEMGAEPSSSELG